MKHDDISPAQFREDMVKKWQRIEESSGNPLASQYFVTVGRGADLGTTAMKKIFHGQNHFLRSTKMKMVHNLGDMDEVLDLKLNEHVNISDEYLTLQNILRSFKVKETPVILSVEETNTPGTYRFLYDETMEKYMADLLSNLDSHIKDIGEWDNIDGHYCYNILEQVTPDDAMRNTENSGFWKTYSATIDSSTTDPLPDTDVTSNKPPQRRYRMPISYSAVVKKQTNRNSKQQSQNMDATTTASTINGSCETFPVFEGINELKNKLAEIDVERNRYSSQQQKVEDDVSTLTQSMHKMASDIIDIRKDMHGLGTQMKEITDILKKQFNMKQADTNMITSPPRKRRTGKKGTGSVSSNEETCLTWASDCDYDMNFEREKGERMIVTKYANGDSDMGGSSAGAACHK
jgi:hypothetical protein